MGITLIIFGVVYVILCAHVTKSSYDIDFDLHKIIKLSDVSIENNIGFYKITVDNYHNNVLIIQIMDPNGNMLDHKKIKTEMSVNYFDLVYNGEYVMKITNLDKTKTKIDVGKINLGIVYYSMIIIISGIAFVLIPCFDMLKVYKIAHPEEKI